MEGRRGRGGRGRGTGRGRGSRPYQNISHHQPEGRRSQSRGNNYNSTENGNGTSHREFFPRIATNYQQQNALNNTPSVTTLSKPKVRAQTVNPEEVGIQLKRKQAITTLLARKPDELGTIGKRIRVISNCFPIKIPSGCVYHYDVKIKKRNVHAELEVKTLDDDDDDNEHSNPKHEAKTIASDQNNSESISIDNDQSDTETKSEANNHKKYRCLNTRINRKVISHIVDTTDIFNGLYPAFDGKKNLYTRKELKSVPFKCEIILTDENRDNAHDSENQRQDIYEVTIKPVKKPDTISCAIDLDSVHAFYEGKTVSLPEEAMMAVETILRHTPCLRLTPVGRSFYYSPNQHNSKPIGGGIETWFGYYQSTRLGQWKPTVNIDISATTFLSEGPILNFIASAIDMSIEGFRRIPVIDEKYIKKINHHLINKEVRVTHLKYPRKYRIVKLTSGSANKILIPDKEMSIADYFKQQHGVTLKYPNLPCLQVKPEERNIFLPLEVCEFTPGQHYKSELTPIQKSNMIRFTTVSAVDRFKKIDGIVQKANFNNDKCAREFNLTVSRQPLELEARVLFSPNLLYGDGKKVTPRNGSWNMKSTQFLTGGKISGWILISFGRPHENLDEFADILFKVGKQLGIKINSLFKKKVVGINDDIEALLVEVKKQADLAVIVIPKVKDKEQKRIYTSIKKAAETVIGLKTQCIKEERLDNMYEEDEVSQKFIQIVRNLCLKINAKTGGENYSLIQSETPKILWKPVIIIGADVSHPSPTETADSKKQFIQPSIAACVGSLDSFCKRFAATVRPQPKTKKETSRTEEIICDLENMTKEILKAFFRHTNKLKPEKIIVYRDGVSEGEFAAVKNREVVSIRKACMSLQEDYEPGITFIVVQKRHHVRFETKDPRDGVKGDVRGGTVADTVVTHPLNFDFYLKSQSDNRGTSRPSYYTVIEDDNDFSANDLQKMTYQFCHTYVRCTKSISIPAPVAYAHLVAYRARKYLQSINFNTNASPSISASTLQDIYNEINVLDDLKDSMYFV